MFLSKKLHWYNFAFATKTTIASVYIGYPLNYVSLSQIREAKEAAEVPQESVILSVCYLGRMTKSTMHNNANDRGVA